MKELKKIILYSGIMVEVDKFGYVFVFSKVMIFVIRNEEKVRKIFDKFFVRCYIGFYLYIYDVFKKYFEVEVFFYEFFEGLE